jgi:hypothetical protein
VAPKREADALAEIKRWGAAVASGVVGLKLRRAPSPTKGHRVAQHVG